MWTKILTELNAAGLSDNEIARRIGINQTTVSRLRNGSVADTAYQTGIAINRLYADVVLRQKAA